MVKLSPSVLSADFLDMKKDIEKLEKAGVEMLHLDVMDGIFVPNISFGVPIIESIKKHASNMLMDVHLMIDRPHRYIKEFAKVSDYLGFHYEAGSDVTETLKEIRSLGCKSCLTIKPCTQPEEIYDLLPLCDMVLVMSVEPGFGGQKFMADMMPKVRELRDYAEMHDLDYEISVDGGVSADNAATCVLSGANVLVAGSSVLGKPDIKSAAEALLSAASIK